jgi:hypothetical protein
VVRDCGRKINAPFATSMFMRVSCILVVVTPARRCVDPVDLLFYERKMRKDPEAKRAVLLLIARGMITVPEAAQLAGVSRQLIHAWCGSKRMSTTRARQAKITRAWRKALMERP